jgi:antitoxin CcdA
MTTHRTTITLDSEAHAFLMSASAENKSAFINQLLKKEKQRSLVEAVHAANLEEAEDSEYQAELAVWDTTMRDGLPADDA